MDDYFTMKEIGSQLGTTSHQVGKSLKALGLRTTDGRPSQKAFQGGYCAQRWTQDGLNYLWAWHGEKTLNALAGKDDGGSGTAAGDESLRMKDGSEVSGKTNVVQSSPRRNV